MGDYPIPVYHGYNSYIHQHKGQVPNAQIDAVAIPYEYEAEIEEEGIRFGGLKLVPLHRIDFDELER